MNDTFDARHLPAPQGKSNGEHKGMWMSGLRLASDILSRASIAARAGLTFGGQRDLYEALGYDRTLRPKDFRDRYRRGDVAARVVDAYPLATWRGGAEVIEDQDPEIDTAFEVEWEELNERLGVWSTFSRADILAGLGRYSVVLIGAEGELEEPLPRLSGQEAVKFLSIFAEDDAEIQTFVDDTQDERFGLPLTYGLRRMGNPNTNSRTQGSRVAKVVHWSRVIHIADGLLDDRVYGQPRLERVWNRFDDLEKVTGGGSEAFWLRVNQGYHWDLDKELNIQSGDIDTMKEKAEEFANGMSRTMTTKGMKLDVLGSDVSNFNNQVTSLISLISGATGIPQRILLGSERGELASTQDKTNWDERVQDRREGFAAPQVVRPFIDRLIDAGGLPTPQEYEIRWPEIKGMDEGERAEIAVKLAGLNKKQGEIVILGSEIRDHVLGLEALDEEDIPEDLLPEPEPDPIPEPVPEPVPDPVPEPEPEPAGARAAPKASRLAGSQSGARPTDTRGGSQD